MPRYIELGLDKRVLEVCILDQLGHVEARLRLAVDRDSLLTFAKRRCEKSPGRPFTHGHACLESLIQPTSPTRSGRSWRRCCRPRNSVDARELTFARSSMRSV